MQTYANRGGDSPITLYEFLDDGIVLRYKGGTNYDYYSSDIGEHHIRAMKEFATAGKGLSTYINQHQDVKKGYRSKY